MAKMDKNVSHFSKDGQNGSKWLKIIQMIQHFQSGLIGFDIFPNGSKWSKQNKMVQNGPNKLKWSKIYRFFSSKKVQYGPNSFKSIHKLPQFV